MTLPEDVAEADEALVVDGAPAIWQHYPAIRAHLLSQEAEIERLTRENGTMRRALETLDAIGHKRADKAESRLAAANALLRECLRYLDPRQYSALIKKLDTHLSEKPHELP